MVTRHTKRIEDSASPSYISHAARRKDYLYRREDAPQARKQRRCLPAAEAAGSPIFFWVMNKKTLTPSHACLDGAAQRGGDVTGGRALATQHALLRHKGPGIRPSASGSGVSGGGKYTGSNCDVPSRGAVLSGNAKGNIRISGI